MKRSAVFVIKESCVWMQQLGKVTSFVVWSPCFLSNDTNGTSADPTACRVFFKSAQQLGPPLDGSVAKIWNISDISRDDVVFFSFHILFGQVWHWEFVPCGLCQPSGFEGHCFALCDCPYQSRRNSSNNVVSRQGNCTKLATNAAPVRVEKHRNGSVWPYDPMTKLKQVVKATTVFQVTRGTFSTSNFVQA